MLLTNIPVEITLLLILLAVLLGGIFLFIIRLGKKLSKSEPDSGLQLLNQQISAAAAQQEIRLGKVAEQMTVAIQNLITNMNERLGQGQQLAQQSQHSVAERLEAAGRTIGDLKGQLGQLSQATQRVIQVGHEVKNLQDILQSPKLRGGLGEWSLENLLAEVLPRRHFELQRRFKNGTIVDALVRLGEGNVCIDAKFPLSNFQLILKAQDEESRQKARRAFLRDIRKHIDTIAEKYICPAEGTLDFALMYVPAENVYYEAMMYADDAQADIGAYGRKRKVIPVSPNTLYAYLMVILTGLRGLQIEKNAQEIGKQLSQLTMEMQSLTNHLLLLGKHLNNARAKHEDAEKQLDHCCMRLQQMESKETDGLSQENKRGTD